MTECVYKSQKPTLRHGFETYSQCTNKAHQSVGTGKALALGALTVLRGIIWRPVFPLGLQLWGVMGGWGVKEQDDTHSHTFSAYPLTPGHLPL